MGLNRVNQPRTQAGKRFLQSREPKLIEDVKRVVVMRSHTASDLVTKVVKELAALQKPNCSLLMQKKKDLRPFDDHSILERYSHKLDAALFAVASHNKKRPHCVTLGRTFDSQLLDMFELSVKKFAGQRKQGSAITAGNKPVLCFSGEHWDIGSDMPRLRNLLIDFFRGPRVERLRVDGGHGLSHVISFTLHADIIRMRTYAVAFGKPSDGERDERGRVRLEPIGPDIDMVAKRCLAAPPNAFRRALRKPKQLTPKRKRNIEKDAFTNVTGRIHMTRQDISKLKVQRSKALKRTGKTIVNKTDKTAPSASEPAKKNTKET